ncbi:MAG: cytochrome c3 family protein [Desulfuromonadales bacterium]|nr:cytochrome c3 family protein [Desulfuromonadales bacterium]
MSSKRIFTIMILTMAIVGMGGFVTAADMPEQVSIDRLSDLFEGVEFDHAMHTELGEDCSVCHHHTTGTGTTDERCISCHADSKEVATVGCSDCHVAAPFSSEHINRKSLEIYQFHIDTPGLKGAYHWNCIGCHEKVDGPTECVDCHARTTKGDAFYHKNAIGSSGAGGE